MTVTAEVMRKVRFAVLVNHHAGFVHAERALRMAAKAHGVREVVPGIGDGRPSTPSSP